MPLRISLRKVKNHRKIKQKVNKINPNKVKQKSKVTIFLEQDDEIIEKEIKKFGNKAAHLILPEKHIGKKALIIIGNSVEKKDF